MTATPHKALGLIQTALPEGAQPGAQWLQSGSTNLKIAATITPFARMGTVCSSSVKRRLRVPDVGR